MKRARQRNGCTLKQVIAAIERLAPPDRAEEWDNVGLLISPSRPTRVRRVMLTIDLTGAVADEAVKRGVDLVVAYHPPIFEPLQRLSSETPAARRLLRILESRIAVYSPHTALDVADGGVNDWLVEGVCDSPESARIEPIEPGPGRLIVFRKRVPLATLCHRIKEYLKVDYLRAAAPPKGTKSVKRVALCAGAGAAALEAADADVWWTGEMKHHDILAANERGITVILSEHTHTERGYLRVFKKRLARELGGDVELCISRADRDPVRVFL